jgi:hypothetical protein
MFFMQTKKLFGNIIQSDLTFFYYTTASLNMVLANSFNNNV